MPEVSSASVCFKSRWKSSYFRLKSSWRFSKSFSRLRRSSSFKTSAFLSYSSRIRSSSSRSRLSWSCAFSNLLFTCSFARLPASHSLSARCMSTTATRTSAAAAAATASTATVAAASSRRPRPIRPAVMGPVALLVLTSGTARRRRTAAGSACPNASVEGHAHLHAQRPHRREPAEAAARRQPRLAERRPVGRRIGVAGVREDDALQPDALHDRKDDLVVEDDLLAAADRRPGDHPAEAVPRLFDGPQRERLEAADRVDAAREVALEERQRVAVEPLVAEPPAEVAAERVGEVAERLRVQEGVVPPLAGLDLRELLPPEASGPEAERLKRARRRVEGVVQRVAREMRRDHADQVAALLGLERARGIDAEVADARPLAAVVDPGAHLLEREAPQRLGAERGHRVVRLQPRPGAAAREAAGGELVEQEAPAKDARAEGERRLAEVGLGEREQDVALEEADVPVQHELLAAAEEVVLANAGVEEEAVRRAEARAGAERPRLPLLHVDDHVELIAAALGPPGADVHLLEEAEPLERVAALAELGARERLLLLEAHLAADDVVAGLGVAGDLDAVDGDRVAAVDRERHVDLLVLLVDGGLRLHGRERVAVVGEPLGELLHVVAQRARVEHLARRGGEILAQPGGVPREVLALERHLADPVLLALVDLDGDPQSVGLALDE